MPSLTELLCDLGVANRIVGRTGFCIHPKELVKDIAKVGGTKTVNIAKLKKLAPSHLVVNIDENDRDVVSELAEFIPHVIVTHPGAPRDNFALYHLFGGIFDCEDAAARLSAELEVVLQKVEGEQWRERRVLYLIWKDPWMSVSRETYVARTLELVGWQQIALADTRRYPALELAHAIKGAELVLLSSEPYSFTEQHRALIEGEFGIATLSIDGELASWYGSRAIASIAELARIARNYNT